MRGPKVERDGDDALKVTVPADSREKVVQLVTGSTGLDDFEWGVTLFAVGPEVLKDVVYTMRFDKGSALYGEFGRFYVGYLAPVDELV